MSFRFITKSIHAYLIDYPVAIVLIAAPFVLKLGQSGPVATWLSVVVGVGFHVQAHIGRRGRIARLIFKVFKMDAFAQPQDRSATIGPRFDYLALAPAAGAICYPFLLRAFHAVVGTQGATPSPLAIV